MSEHLLQQGHISDDELPGPGDSPLILGGDSCLDLDGESCLDVEGENCLVLDGDNCLDGRGRTPDMIEYCQYHCVNYLTTVNGVFT